MWSLSLFNLCLIFIIMWKYFTAFFLILTVQIGFAQVTLTVESGAAFNGYNDVRFGNEEGNMGTLFSLTDDFSNQAAVPYLRLEAKWRFAGRNTIELTAAPLAFEFSGLEIPVIFGDRLFDGPNVDARYEFNTYRLSYRYLLVNSDKWKVGLGASVLMRDARIALSQGSVAEETTDLGFVPLISFDVRYEASKTISLLLKGDGLLGPVGRAEDVFIGIEQQIFAPGLKYRLGYRIIEGGADVAQVYNFSLINFAAIGISYTF